MRFFLFLLIVILSATTYAQNPTEQDCLGAIPICQNKYQTVTSYSGTGNYPNEINDNTSCLTVGEKNNVWYIFTVQTSGKVNFDITPNNLNDDYDWAVYNISNKTCAEIYNNQSMEVSCNFSSKKGVTGPNGTSSLNSQSASGSTGNAAINVTSGQTYVINVSNYSSSQNGYTIDFKNSTAVIYDNIPPKIDSISSINCGDSMFTIFFSEKVLCNTVQPTDFTMINNATGINYTIKSVESLICQQGGDQEKQFRIKVSPPIQQGLQLFNIVNTAGSVSDLCGNLANPSTTNITANPSIIKVKASAYTVICNGESVTLNATASGGTKNYTYSWNPSAAANAQLTTSPSVTTTYTVTLNDGCGSPKTDTVSVKVIPIPSGLNFDADIKTGCQPLITSFTNITAGNNLCTWDFGNSIVGKSCDTSITFVNAGQYSVTLTVSTPEKGCSASITKTNYITVYDNPKANFTWTPDLPTLNDEISFFDESTNDASWQWSFINHSRPSSIDENPFRVYSETGEHCIKLKVTSDKNCVDSITKCLTIKPDLTLYIPNAFTPNADSKNEVFMVKGYDFTDFNITIFNRWGELVFQTDNITKGWNGRLNNEGRTLDKGVYAYKVTVTDLFGEKQIRTGHVTLIR